VNLVNSTLYWTQGVPRALMRSNLDGSGQESIGPIGLLGQDIALDLPAGHIYWVSGHDTISRANLDGSDRVEFLTDLQGVSGLALRREPSPVPAH
jgi:hypothetical protein